MPLPDCRRPDVACLNHSDVKTSNVILTLYISMQNYEKKLYFRD
jgi:hypothetical protein